jgi:lipid II:glycine glycyltransferase (peptidoglycan interpeptide bridge formation enzyme)
MLNIDSLLRAYADEVNLEDKLYLLQELEDEITKEYERVEYDLRLNPVLARRIPVVLDLTR